MIKRKDINDVSKEINKLETQLEFKINENKDNIKNLEELNKLSMDLYYKITKNLYE